MRIVRLNGELGKKYGRVHKLDVRTPGEAVRALCANFPELHADLLSSGERGIAYKCVTDKEVIEEGALSHPFSQSFSITPIVAGAGKALTIILGVALIVAAIAMPAFIPVFSVGGTTFGFGASATLMLGVAVTLGGIAQLLAPTPKINDPSQKNENAFFDGATNTTAQGAAVPVGYGRMIVGSAVISAAITVEQAPDPFSLYDFQMMGFAGGIY